MRTKHTNPAILPLSAAVALLTAIGCVPTPTLAPELHETIVGIDVALEADRTPPNPSTVVKPHVTVLRGFMSDSNLSALTASVAMVMATTDLDRVTVRASGASTPALAVDPSPELRRLHERMVEAFMPYAVTYDTAQSFIVTTDGAPMSYDTMRSVGHYVPFASGANYRPQIVGVGQAPSAFKPMGAAVYQLDKSGNAQRTLWTWTGEMGAR